ncbi:MAG: helix-turn-helix transcriptional regulator [Deltaproteobacteria bacterium]|nr:helix-turn-helix transcriptional regulator [Deltaproteobacteria bacterium]
MRDFEQIQRLVGNITEEQLRYVECAVHHRVGLFMPMAGQCEYATSPEHTHPAYSFILAFDDRCHTRIGDVVVQSVPSTMAMMAPGFAHQELPGETVSRYIAVLIDATFFETQKKLYGIVTQPNPADLYPFSDRLVQACREFLVDYQEAYPGYEQLLESGELKICHLIIRQIFGIAQKEPPVVGSITIHRAVEYIYANYAESLTVGDMAHKANLSTSHFTRLFRREMGIAPAEYLLQIRLNVAKRMLQANDRTLTDIAFDCGFGSSSYFSHSFSKAFGMAPSLYRKRYAPTGSGPQNAS